MTATLNELSDVLRQPVSNASGIRTKTLNRLKVPAGMTDQQTADWVVATLRARVEPHMQHYLTDLSIDEEMIRRDPHRPFVHLTREMGTHVWLMPDADACPTEVVPYIFSSAPRRQIMTQSLDMLRTYPYDSPRLWTLYEYGVLSFGVSRDGACGAFRSWCIRAGVSA